MDFLNLAKERFSARAFSAQVVEEDKVNYLLACAQRAPSACNKQPWHFVWRKRMRLGRRCSSAITANG